MAKVHYQSLSRGFQSRESFSGIDPPRLRTRGSKVSEDVGLLQAYATQQRHNLPRNYRTLRIAAYAGWGLAALLLASHLISYFSPFDAVPRVDFGMSGLAPGVEQQVLERQGASGGGIHSRVTIVSGFYKVESGKKHSVSDYNKWLATFLRSVDLPIVFYCAPSMRAFISELRGQKPITIISNFETPFDMPPLASRGGREWAVAQHAIDPEKHVHVPDVYGVWTAKPWIVKQAAELNPYDSEYFFWVDAGGFRDPSITHSFSGLPAQLDNIYERVPEDTLILSATTVPFEAGTDYVKKATLGGIMDRSDRLQGGWYGGKKSAVDWWDRETRKVTTVQAGLQRFSAKEQPIWTQAARLNWQKIYVQNMSQRKGTDCGPDMWFGFEYFADGRDCEIPAWVGPHYARQESRGGELQWNTTRGLRGMSSS